MAQPSVLGWGLGPVHERDAASVKADANKPRLHERSGLRHPLLGAAVVSRRTTWMPGSDPPIKNHLPLRRETLLHSSGASVKTTQELLRHASPVMTLGTYAKAVTQEKRSAQANIATLFLPTAETGIGTLDP